MEIRDGIWDYMSETTVSTMNEASGGSTYSARVTFIEGVTEVEFTGVTAVATNGQTIVNPEGPITVSRNATVFYNDYYIELGWLREVEVLHDPLHLQSDYDVRLDAEDFEAPKGFTASAVKVTFSNCAFKTVPKLYSDELMAETPVWPPMDYNSSGRFLYDCPNVEKIAQQGHFGDNLKVLVLSSDFTYIQDGRLMLDALPTGGAPEVILSTMNLSLNWEDTLPSWGMSKLKICLGLLDGIDLVAKKGTTPAVPLLGLDFASATQLEYMDFGFNLHMEEDYEKDIVVTTGSLGIVLPDTVKKAPGAWRMWQNSTEAGKEAHVATPDGLRALELDGWADALEDYVGDRLTKDAMPLTPSGLVEAQGYYMKFLSNFDHNKDWVTSSPQDRMAHRVSLAAKIMIDGVQSQFTIQPLPPTVKRADFYAAGTYQHSEVVTDITIPAIPSSATVVDGAYMRTFYQAIGKEVKSDEVEFPQMVLTSVNHSEKGDLYECAKPEDIKLNESLDVMYNVVLVEDGPVVNMPWLEVPHSYSRSGGSQRDDTSVEYSYDRIYPLTEDSSINENYGGVGIIYVIQDWMKNTVVTGRYVTAEITNSIVLEREPLPNVTSAEDFQLETFYGSGVMPNRVNCLIPVSGTVPTGRSYQAAINVKPVRESTVMPNAIYRAFMPFYAIQDSLSPGGSMRYILRYYSAMLRPELQKYTFNSDELIIESGLTGADHSFIGLLPTTTRFTATVGDFASAHGIGGNLESQKYLSGVFTSNPRWTLMSPMTIWWVPGGLSFYTGQGFSYSYESEQETGQYFQAPSTDSIPGSAYAQAIDAYAIYLHTQDGQKSYQAANGG